MSEDPSNSTSSASATPSAPSPRPRGRRASIASGTSFSELFARPGSSAAPPQHPPAVSINIPGSIMTSANAQAQQRRRTSISTLGLSGSPTQQSSPFGSAPGMRRGSISSSAMSGSPTWEDSVLEENGNDTPMSSPTAPFTRRVSFGAQAFRDRVGSANANGRYPSGNSTVAGRRAPSTASSTSSPAASEGFNWPEALRTRAGRAPSFGSFPPSSPTAGFHGSPPNHSSAPHFKHHQRAASIAIMEQPVREMRDTQQQPKPKQKPKPDYFQEKILRGDFMD
ncbi:hypothetical protein I7I51_04545 [Histoplasma capsulatum]|uniref:Uncharacterized protein n=1 Tax=Ajellomyces capsulatus TaxID=5037 RepID=A0A8A1MDZ3_AJECA|nr:predicted protein [Histoplasma mississippiense (nom. inval.)]EDN07541.1 predicted protein [Histoplasma mississippiense (nom. inval.)]QSS62367.1 hypothetical protein I7I51_04545 [Histoplasma capsulatum]